MENEREFFYLDESALTYERVMAASREQHSPGLWFVRGKGTCTVGYQLFNTLPELLSAAKVLLHRKEAELDQIRKNLNGIQSDVTF